MDSFQRAMEWAEHFGSTWARYDPVCKQMVHGTDGGLVISPIKALLAFRPWERSKHAEAASQVATQALVKESAETRVGSASPGLDDSTSLSAKVDDEERSDAE